MDSYRTDRLNRSILRVLSDLLQVAVKDPRVGIVSINSVELNRDHSVAKVFFSVIGEEEERGACLAGLKKARGFLQGRLGRTLHLRMAPQLRFVYDDSLDHGLGIESVLRDLEEKGEFESERERSNRRVVDDLEVPPELLDGLLAGHSFWIVPHWNPDPDAVGAALALAAALQSAGKLARVLSYPDVPVTVEELPGYGETLAIEDAEKTYDAEKPDALVVVDCHRLDRTGPLCDLLARFEKVWSIDHHLVSGRRAPLPGWCDPTVCSACTLVYRVVTEMSRGADGRFDLFEIDVDMATCLYAGLLTDTGGFRFTNTTPLTFELAGRLARQGVDAAAVSRRHLHRHRIVAIDLLQRVLASCRMHDRNRIITMYVDRQMLKDSGATLADCEGFINIATATDGVRYVVMIKEVEEGIWRCSLRVRGDEGDVQVVAARFGGGGHRQAAGCTIEGEVGDVLDRLVGELLDGM